MSGINGLGNGHPATDLINNAGENYTFRDESGEVEVEVDGDVWRGVEVGPNDLIRIRGEVDHSWNKTEVEVEHLEKVGAAPQSKGGFIAK